MSRGTIGNIIVFITLVLVGYKGRLDYYEPPIIIEPEEEITTENNTESNVPYSAYFKEYSSEIQWDWRLLAALCYHESRYNAKIVAASGASGLMQLMPRTAYRFGLNDSTILEPKDNIRAGVQYIKYLQRTFSFIDNKTEQQNFIIASYNAGPAHIMDARRLAKKYGSNPQIWFDNTAYWLEKLQEDEYANDSVVIYGTFNPTETLNHVRKVRNTYNKLKATESEQ